MSDRALQPVSPASGAANALDRWLLDGAARLGHDRALSAALDRLAAHADSRGCLVLLGEMLAMPGLVDRLSDTLMPKERT